MACAPILGFQAMANRLWQVESTLSAACLDARRQDRQERLHRAESAGRASAYRTGLQQCNSGTFVNQRPLGFQPSRIALARIAQSETVRAVRARRYNRARGGSVIWSRGRTMRGTSSGARSSGSAVCFPWEGLQCPDRPRRSAPLRPLRRPAPDLAHLDRESKSRQRL